MYMYVHTTYMYVHTSDTTYMYVHTTYMYSTCVHVCTHTVSTGVCILLVP